MIKSFPDYDELLCKFSEIVIENKRIKDENEELKRVNASLVEEKCTLCKFNLNKMNGRRLENEKLFQIL